MIYTTITNCRVCGSEGLVEVGSLGNLKVNDFPDKKDVEVERAPLTLVECRGCTLLQLKDTVRPDLMYKKYWYLSGLNDVIVQDLKEIAEQAIAIAKPKKGDVFLDVGANDGTLLSFVPKEFYRVGVEPALNIVPKLEEHCDVVFPIMWEEVDDMPKAKIITAIGMFYDSVDPNIFMRQVKKFLTDDGLFVSQLMTLTTMIEKNDLGNICHEHLEYYTYKSLVRLFEQNGLEIWYVEKNNINGGSYRIFARHYKTGSGRIDEPKYDYKAFFERLAENKKKTLEFLEGKNVYGYGASTKGNIISQYFGLAPYLKGILDKNPEKWGKFTVDGVPIVGDCKADFYYVFPWGFLDHFMKQEKGRWIVSIPEFKVYENLSGK